MPEKVQASRLAEVARQVYQVKPPHKNMGRSLAGMDGAGFIHYCFKQLGITVPYSGTNALYRAIGGIRMPLKDALAQGKVVPGVLLFRVNPSGAEKEVYRKDGLGDADFATICVDPKTAIYVSGGKKEMIETKIELVNGKANMVVFHPALDYGTGAVPGAPMPPIAPINPHREILGYMVVIGGKKLNLREKPSLKGARQAQIPDGTVIPVFSRKDGWIQSEYVENGILKSGWCSTDFLREHNA